MSVTIDFKKVIDDKGNMIPWSAISDLYYQRWCLNVKINKFLTMLDIYMVKIISKARLAIKSWNYGREKEK